MKIYVRFIRQGCLEAETPDNFDSMTPEEKLNWANEYMENSCSDKEILDAMADFKDPDKNRYFDQAPEAAAIESAEDGHEHELLVQRAEWEIFSSGEYRNILK